MSESDIEKGSRSLNEIASALSGIKVGILCLTPENLEAPWLLFEGAALSKTIDDKTRLCTYLLGGLRPQDVKVPLGMFQATRADKEDTRKLVRTINRAVSTSPIKDEYLDKAFDAMWPQLEESIRSLPQPERTVDAKRNSEDMIAEILELSRATAASRKSVETLDKYIPMVEELMPLLEHGIRAAKAAGLTANAPVSVPGDVQREVDARKQEVKFKEVSTLQGSGKLISGDAAVGDFEVSFSFTVVTKVSKSGAPSEPEEKFMFGNVWSRDGRSIPDGQYDLHAQSGEVLQVRKGGPAGWSVQRVDQT
jgi:hypothetical protein